MSAGFKVDGEVFWGTNGAVEEYVIALADVAADRFGPDHPLAAFLADERDGFHMGKVVFLDEWLTDDFDRRRFLGLLDAATERVVGSFSEYGREWVDTTMADLRDRIAAGTRKADEPGPTKFKTLDALQVVFGVAACSWVFFAISGPAQNGAQALFRLGVSLIGLIGLVVVLVLKRNRRGRSWGG